MPFIIRSNIIDLDPYYGDTYHDEILAVFCDENDAINYIENNKEKFSDNDYEIFEYWKGDELKYKKLFKYFDFKM